MKERTNKTQTRHNTKRQQEMKRTSANEEKRTNAKQRERKKWLLVHMEIMHITQAMEEKNRQIATSYQWLQWIQGAHLYRNNECRQIHDGVRLSKQASSRRECFNSFELKQFFTLFLLFTL